MRFKFLQYGIYVDLGTGKGYKRGNGGDLKFLGKDYRKEHNPVSYTHLTLPTICSV